MCVKLYEHVQVNCYECIVDNKHVLKDDVRLCMTHVQFSDK